LTLSRNCREGLRAEVVTGSGEASRRRRAATLRGRGSEVSALGRIVEAVRAGESRVLVIRGEPGVGKTALLDQLATAASAGCQVVRAVGVQSEMELAFAGLHQLCAPMLNRLGSLPEPQREALQTAFGLSSGPAPDRFLVGLAVLSLLSEAAGDQPLMCLVDDHQWLDRASAQALGFVARRLAAEPVGLVFAARDPGDELAGLPELAIEGLREADARALLDSVLAGPLDARVRDQVVAETRGNPLALLELPRGLTPAELAGGFGLAGARPLSGRIEESFLRQIQALPPEARRLLQLAAADPSGDMSLVWRAAGQLGIPVQAGAPAVEAGLAEFSPRVRFRHPLVRSAAYRSASVQDRREIHGMLAAVTDPQLDPDRRAWHRAEAAPGPDEEVADELERSAGRAQGRGGLAAAAAFMERAALLTPDPVPRTRRPSRPIRSTRCRPRRWSGCAGRLPWTSGVAVTRTGCYSVRRGASSRSTPGWPARRTWTRWWPRYGPTTWAVPACRRPPKRRAARHLVRCRRAYSMSCSTRSRCG
jgi:AAA ATPase domain